MTTKTQIWIQRLQNTAFWDFLRYAKRWYSDGLLKLTRMEPTERALLIIRLDAIGDYILFRNFLKIIRESDRFQYHHITLCGNEQWKDLAETLDAQYVDQCIWIQLDRFWNDLRYRKKIMKTVNKRGYDTVVHPVFSRRSMQGDALVRVVSAHEKIGMAGDALHNPTWQKRIADKWYTKLIELRPETCFEFCRTKEFFENILGTTIPITGLSIDTPCQLTGYNVPKPYAVLCPGGSLPSHRWNTNNFMKVAEYLFRRYNLTSVLVGSISEQLEKNIQHEIAQYHYIMNCIGQTTLVETVGLIQSSALVISNETSIAHIAVAADKPVVVISNGNRFGRFTEYPESVYNKIRYAYAPEVFKVSPTFAGRVEYFQKRSTIDVNSVTVPQVTQSIDELILPTKT